MRLGFRPGRSTKDCFDDALEPHHYKREGRNPDRCDATRFGRHRSERHGLVSGPPLRPRAIRMAK